MPTQACMFTTFLSVTYALFLYPKGGENMEDNSIIAVIRFVNGESIRIRCSEYSFDLQLVCFDDDKVVFVAPIGQIVCIYEEKYRIFD